LLVPRLTGLEDTRRNEFVDLAAHHRVAQGFLACSLGRRVLGRQVLNDLPHDGVLQNRLDFGVGHPVGRALFALVFRHALRRAVDELHGFHEAVAARLGRVVERQTL